MSANSIHSPRCVPQLLVTLLFLPGISDTAKWTHNLKPLGVSVTDSNRRLRTRTHGGYGRGRRANAALMPIKSRCHQQLIMSSQPRELSPPRAVSVPLALHCMELAALEAICRKLTTYNYVERWFRIPLSPPYFFFLFSSLLSWRGSTRGAEGVGRVKTHRTTLP